ncbi:hypothetical protein MMC13_002847 [Lambiella insularis]|nr:hypothetical protein [Lambiella insularis]
MGAPQQNTKRQLSRFCYFGQLLEEVRTILATAEPSLRNAIWAQLDGSTFTIKVMSDRMSRKYGESLGINASTEWYHGLRRKVGWAFEAAKELAAFYLELARQLENVKILLLSQLWQKASESITATCGSRDTVLKEFGVTETALSAVTKEIAKGVSQIDASTKTTSSILDSNSQQLCDIQKHQKDGAVVTADQMFQLQSRLDSLTLEVEKTHAEAAQARSLAQQSLDQTHHIAACDEWARPSIEKHVEEITKTMNNVYNQDSLSRATDRVRQAEQLLQVEQGVQHIVRLLAYEEDNRKAFAPCHPSPFTSLSQWLTPNSLACTSVVRSTNQGPIYLLSFLRALRAFLFQLMHICPQLLLWLGTLRGVCRVVGHKLCLEDHLGQLHRLDTDYIQYFDVLDSFIYNTFKNKLGGKKINELGYNISCPEPRIGSISVNDWERVVLAKRKLVLSVAVKRFTVSFDNCPSCKGPWKSSDCMKLKICSTCDSSFLFGISILTKKMTGTLSNVDGIDKLESRDDSAMVDLNCLSDRYFDEQDDDQAEFNTSKHMLRKVSIERTISQPGVDLGVVLLSL